MESPAPESPMEGEDAVYPCKGCGEILEEGKAFELAGNRWHIDCFRCNTCGTLLDSDANLLLLGDGSLICNNCTYSCNACGNKIEDLAILTGDQAFCASCFRCRNCKRKIENLRYARTSQGIFCMSCHESLMARRRKKAKGTRSVTGGTNGPGSTTTVEKALPSLPPGAATESAFSPEMETPPEHSTPGSRSTAQRTLRSEKDAPSNHHRRDVSPMSDDMRRDGPTLPASTYKEGRGSRMSSLSDDGENEGFLPMAFDPNPAPRPSVIPRKRVPQMNDMSPAEPPPPRDYFSGRTSSKAHRDVLRDERPSSSRSVSTERDHNFAPQSAGQSKASPHIAYQEKGRPQKRLTSGQTTPASTASPAVGGAQERPERPKPQTLDTSSFTLGRSDGFKLQEVPKTKKSGSRSDSGKENKSPSLVSPIEPDENELSRRQTESPVSAEESPQSDINPFDDPRRKEGQPSGHAPSVSKFPERPARGDSLAASSLKPSSIRSSPEAPTPTTFATSLQPSHGRQESSSSIPGSFADAQSVISRNDSRSMGLESPPVRSSFDVIPPRASSRPSAPSKSVGNNGDFITPRLPPPPPPAERHNRGQDSISSTQLDTKSDGQLSPALRSAGLPKHTADGAFSMEEEMARILRGDKPPADKGEASMLRRVSKAVKHGRSFSDRGVPKNGAHIEPALTTPMTISSPIMSSPSAKDTPDSMRASLRRAQAKIAELEAQNSLLEERVSGSGDIKQVNSELREKRTTMAFLDTQREMVVRELEVMTDHLGKVKDKNQPLDLSALKDSIFRELSESLQKLKDQMGGQIEDLIRKRTELTDEIGNLIQMKDRGFQEYENLTTKNAQLVEMNNNLLQSIQDMYKSSRGESGKHIGANGLGIYQPGAKGEKKHEGAEVRNLNLVHTDGSMPHILNETEAEPATILTAPQVVNIRKGQPKKFNWRKGGEKMAKNVTKGIKGAFATERVQTKDGLEIGTPYGMTQQAVGGGEQGSFSSKQGPPGGAGFGFFGQKNGGLKAGSMKNNSSTNLSAPSNDPSVLFGTDLELRCEFEKRLIPAIVSRCIEEVEERGMDMEGVYRKSGGSGQVKTIQAGFEKEPNSYDISDPDLDIHAVTSALKQYFRKLPTPLITYDVYDSLLEAGQLSNISAADGESHATSSREKQILALRSAVNDLPEHHRNCLEYLCQHLRRVMSMQDRNLMTSLNLAVVFAPTIMRPSSIEREMSDMLAQRTAVQALLELGESVFGEEDEDED
ncbi:hypothetical protein Q7P37_000083 [Cladosporium fusiforme]